jgi:hypothetical protein
MKDLEVKAMLADPNIPDSYKLGGRLDERFLAGVEHAEAAVEKAPTMWLARELNGLLAIFNEKPRKLNNRFIGKGVYMFDLRSKTFPSLTFEDSPRKVRLILEDEE